MYFFGSGTKDFDKALRNAFNIILDNIQNLFLFMKSRQSAALN